MRMKSIGRVIKKLLGYEVDKKRKRNEGEEREKNHLSLASVPSSL